MRLRERDIPKKVAEVTAELQTKWKEFFMEEARAIHGLGKNRLSPGYNHFYVDPAKWNRRSPERQRQHISCFHEFVPKSYNSYKKPSSAGHKTLLRSNRRRAKLPDANPPAKKASVSPLYLSKGSRSSQLQVIIKYTPKVLFTIVRYSVRPCNQEVDTIQHVQTYIHILRM